MPHHLFDDVPHTAKPGRKRHYTNIADLVSAYPADQGPNPIRSTSPRLAAGGTDLPPDRCWFWCGPVRITPDIKLILASRPSIQPEDFPRFYAYPVPKSEQESLGHVYLTRIEHYLWAKHRPNDPLPSRFLHPCPPFMASHWHPRGPKVRCACINPHHMIGNGATIQSVRRKIREPKAARELHTDKPAITLAEGRRLFPGLFK